MKTITVDEFLDGIESIYVEQPGYQPGHDGSDGTCDCIGMPRGASKRKGVTDIKNFSGTNMAARKTITELSKIGSAGELKKGMMVLKTRDKDDADYPLPDRYRKGHADYDPDVGETNFTHIGTVTRESPLEITHMTSPKPKKDTKQGNWKYRGKLPWVRYGEEPGPEPEPTEWARVVADKGSTVKMRAKPTTSCKLYWDVPIGAEVIVYEWEAAIDKNGKTWSRIRWAGQDGYMMASFLQPEMELPGKETTYRVIIKGLDLTQAKALVNNYPGSDIEEED